MRCGMISVVRMVYRATFLLSIVMSSVTITSGFDDISTVGCNTTKNCMRYPTGCPASGCKLLLTWNVSEPGYVDFEMMAVTSGWVAFGLSFDTRMGNDSVTVCSVSNAALLTQINVAFNGYWFNTIMSPVSPTVLKNMSSAYVNGTLQCRFQRSIASSQSNIFPLNYYYYLFLGYGRVNQDTFVMLQHEYLPIVSPNQINVTSGVSTMVPSASSSSPTPSSATIVGNSMKFYPDGNNLHLELTGAAMAQWVALGFSKDQQMGDDSVVSCSLASPSGTTIVAKFSYNDGHTNTPVANVQNGITIISSSIDNGQIKCALLVQAFGLGNPKIFDLNNTAYFLLLGSGMVDQNGVLQMHTQNPQIWSKLNVMDANGTTPAMEAAESTSLLKAHGTLMITAWVLLVNPAILLARYFKTAWPKKTLFKTAVWFTMHRTLNILALFCTAAGFIIIFVHAGLPAPQTINDIYGENRSLYAGYYFAHAPLGIIVMILVIINPVAAIFRCDPKSTNRFVFNWIHWSIGTVLQIVALINVFFGVKMGETNPDTDHRICHIAVFWILIAFVAFHIVVESALFIHKLLDQRENFAFSTKYEHEMQSPGHTANDSEDTKDEPTRTSLMFRYTCLAVYVTVVLGLWLAMIILIGSGKVN